MKYYVIDANVMLIAGKSIAEVSKEELHCRKKCIDFIHEVVKRKGKVVVDDGWKVLNEYVKNCKAINGYPNNSENFYRYVMNYSNRSEIHLNEVGYCIYEPYPNSTDLKEFDAPDRKYIALAYSHKKNPRIIEASDSKWWGIRNELEKNGIEIIFVDEEYIKKMYEKKMI